MKTPFRAPVLLAALAGLAACPPPPPPTVQQLTAPVPADYSKFWPQKSCNNCHERIYTQYTFSSHADSFQDPVFQAQYFGHLVPRMGEDPELRAEAESCLRCHAPIVSLQHGKDAVNLTREQVEAGLSGVTCDFCHTVRGYTGDRPGNANYINVPGELKMGPFKIGDDWHHVYMPLMNTSEFCAMCHSARNVHGAPLRTTYEEWKGSEYAKAGIQCQDCHMSAKGFLVDGKAVFQSGRAAQMTLGAPPQEREKLYSHRFPGAHTNKQLQGALKVRVVNGPDPIKQGQTVKIEVVVENSNVGHKIPSGSAELRTMWLEVHVGLTDEDPGVLLTAPTRTTASQPLDVAGASPWDAQLLRADAPRGSRVYRAVFTDEQGRPTLTNYAARTLVFDGRLEAGEKRHEVFEYVVPKLAPGDDLHVTATLKYLRFPSLFAQDVGTPPAEVVEVASGTGIVGAPEEVDER